MSTAPYQRLTAQQAQAWLAAHPDALVLDARDAAAHQAGAIRGAAGQCQRLDGRNHEPLLMGQPRQRPVFICCYHGNASQTYAAMFVDFGFGQVADLIGGYEAWQRAGLAGNGVVAAAEGAAPVAALPTPTAPASAEVPVVDPTLAAWLQQQGFADAHSATRHGNTPLMHAAWRGEAAIVAALLAQGADITAVNHDGNTALWLACVANDPALVATLVQAGAAIDHANLTGATCLMYAASSSKPAIVQALLTLGANPALTTQDDFSALDMAASLDCLQLLRAAQRRAA